MNTKTKSEHSALPWAVRRTKTVETQIGGHVASCGTNGSIHDEANATFIVQACNNHGRLVAFIEELSKVDGPTDIDSYVQSARALLAELQGGKGE